MAALLYTMSESGISLRVARGLLMSTVLVPLIVATSFFFPYIVPRTIFFRVVVEITLGILVYLLAARDWRIKTHFDFFFWGLFAFTAASALSALFSPARNRAMFGDFERMGGVWSLLHYLLFYALLRVFFREKEWKLYLNLCLGVSALVSGVALYQGAANAGVTATIGNPGLLALYLFLGVCLSTYLAFQSGRLVLRAVYAGSAVLGLAAITVSHNRASFLGLAAAAAVALIVYFIIGRRHRRTVAAMGVVTVLGVGIAMTLVARSPDGWVSRRLPATFGRIATSGLQTADANRMVLWTAAFAGFRDRPLVGYGPENYHLAWSAHFQPRIYTATNEQRVDRAHNIMLEVLSTTGIIGFAAFLAMWAALFFSISAGLRNKLLSLSDGAFFAGLSIGYLAALVFWFIDINSFVPWVALCAFLGSKLSAGEVMEFHAREPLDGRGKVVLGAGILAIAASLWLHAFETARVSRLLYSTQVSGGDVPVTLHNFFKVFDSPAPQTTHTPILFGRYMGLVVPRLRSGPTDPATRALIDTAFARGIVEMERERNRDPRNELIYLQQSRLSLLASAYYGLPAYYAHAVETLRKAVTLSPERVQPRLVLAYTLMMGKQYDEAEAQLDSAKAIYPTSGQIFYYIAELRRLRGDLRGAAAALDSSLTLGYRGPADVYLAVIDGLQAKPDYSGAARLAETYLARTLTGYKPEGSSRKLKVESAEIVPLLARLPWLWAKAGNVERSLAAVNNFLAAHPQGAASAGAFVRSLITRDGAWERESSLLK